MAKYGAKLLQWAPFAASSPDANTTALPHYGTPANLGELVKVTDSPAFNEGKIYGDNALAEHVVEFKECGIDVEVTELSASVAASIFGATLASSNDDTDLKFGADDTAPYGGLAFYVCKMIDGVKKYQGVYYPKVKATMQGDEYATKGDGITLTGGKIHFTAGVPANGKWKLESSDIASESDAATWVNTKIAAYVADNA